MPRPSLDLHNVQLPFPAAPGGLAVFFSPVRASVRDEKAIETLNWVLGASVIG
jgi:hypothetical protein